MIIHNIQVLRGIAALFVVIYHLRYIELKYSSHKILSAEITKYGVFGVDLFFVISGFIMVIISQKQFDGWQSAKTFFIRRIIRVYPIYWFFTLLTLFAFLLQPTWVNSSQGYAIDWINTVFLTPSFSLPLLSVGWTLVHEIYFYIMFTLLIATISEKWLLHCLAIWAVIIFIANAYLNITDLATTRLIFSPMTLEFIGGAFVALLYLSKNTHLKLVSLILISGVGFYLCIGPLEMAFDQTNPRLYDNAGDWRRVMTYIFPAIIVLSVMLILEPYKTRLSRLWHSMSSRIGDSSYSLYLSHILVLSACGRLWQYFTTSSIIENYIVLPVILLIAVIVGILSFEYVEKPLIKLIRRHLKS